MFCKPVFEKFWNFHAFLSHFYHTHPRNLVNLSVWGRTAIRGVGPRLLWVLHSLQAILWGSIPRECGPHLSDWFPNVINSGKGDKQRGIAKCGNKLLRQWLIRGCRCLIFLFLPAEIYFEESRRISPYRNIAIPIREDFIITPLKNSLKLY